ncbi:MAG: hypothetical protein ACOC6F_01720 [bacterium]
MMGSCPLLVSAPTNWDDQLLYRYTEITDRRECRNRIQEVYGAACETPTGGGRPTVALPETSPEAMARHIGLAASLGLEFNYLLNAPQLGNKEFAASGYREITDHVHWLADLGVGKVTVAVPFLLELCKARGMQVEVSAVAGVHTKNEYSRWLELGADAINLSPERNRDFVFLEGLDSARGKILVNEICLLECPVRGYHYNCVANASRTGARKEYVDYCILYCASRKLRHPVELVRSPFVLPADVAFYKGIVGSIKLSDRRLPTDKLVRIATAYATEEYDGNFFEIASMPIPEKQLLAKIAAAAGDVGIAWDAVATPELTLESGRFNGRFLQYFLQGKCSRDCAKCDYCLSWSEHVSVSQHHELISALDELRQRLVRGQLQAD